MDEFRLKHGKGFGVTYVVNSDKTKYGTLEGDCHRVWRAIKNKNHHNKAIAQDLNLNESTTLRLLSAMEHLGLIEKKWAHEVKISEAPESIKEFIKSKDMRTKFYFIIGKETKSHTPGESNKSVVKELKQLRNQINDMNTRPQESPHSIITLFALLFGISLMIASLLTIFGYINAVINLIGLFMFGLGLILMLISGTGLIVALKKRKELSLPSK